MSGTNVGAGLLNGAILTNPDLRKSDSSNVEKRAIETPKNVQSPAWSINLESDDSNFKNNFVSAPVFDGYTPSTVAATIPKNLIDTDAKINQAMKWVDNYSPEITATILNIMGPILNAQTAALNAMSGLLEQFLEVFDLSAKILGDLAKNTLASLKEQHEKALEEARAATKKQGIFAIIFGLVEALIGVVSIALSIGASVGTFGVASVAGAIGVAGGVLAIVNGLSKVIGGSMAVANPDKNKEKVGKLMSDGVFSIFGNNSATVGQVVSIVTGILGGFSGIASSASAAVGGIAKAAAAGISKAAMAAIAKAVIPAVLNLGNTLVTLTGNIGSLVYNAQKSDSDASEEDGANFWQGMSMGLLALTTQAILENKDVKAYLKDKMGDEGQMILEIVSYFVMSMATSVILGSMTKNAEFKDASKSGFEKFPALDKFFTPPKVGLDSVSKADKLGKAIKEIVKTGQVTSAVTSLGSSGLNTFKALSQINLTELDSDGKMRTLLLELFKRLTQGTDDQDRETQGVVTANAQDLAKTSTAFFSSLGDLMDSKIQFNAR